MRTAPDGRRLFVWLGRDPIEDTNRLADVVAETAGAELFNLDGLCWLNDEGQLVPARKDVLRKIIARHIVSIRLVNRGSRWECEYHAFDFPFTTDASKEPNEQVLVSLMSARRKEDGGLAWRVAKVPSDPRRLSPQQQEEVRARLRVGEPKARIAAAYGVDEAMIARLAQ